MNFENFRHFSYNDLTKEEKSIYDTCVQRHKTSGLMGIAAASIMTFYGFRQKSRASMIVGGLMGVSSAFDFSESVWSLCASRQFLNIEQSPVGRKMRANLYRDPRSSSLLDRFRTEHPDAAAREEQLALSQLQSFNRKAGLQNNQNNNNDTSNIDYNSNNNNNAALPYSSPSSLQQLPYNNNNNNNNNNDNNSSSSSDLLLDQADNPALSLNSDPELEDDSTRESSWERIRRQQIATANNNNNNNNNNNRLSSNPNFNTPAVATPANVNKRSSSWDRVRAEQRQKRIDEYDASMGNSSSSFDTSNVLSDNDDNGTDNNSLAIDLIPSVTSSSSSSISYQPSSSYLPPPPPLPSSSGTSSLTPWSSTTSSSSSSSLLPDNKSSADSINSKPRKVRKNKYGDEIYDE